MSTSIITKNRRKEIFVMYNIKNYFEMLNNIFNLINFEDVFLIDSYPELEKFLSEDINLNAKPNDTDINIIEKDFLKICFGYLHVSNRELANLTCSNCPTQLLQFDVIETLSTITYRLGLYIKLNANKNNILYTNLLNKYNLLVSML